MQIIVNCCNTAEGLLAMSVVAMPLMISTSGMTGTGFMKCMPTCMHKQLHFMTSFQCPC